MSDLENKLLSILQQVNMTLQLLRLVHPCDLDQCPAQPDYARARYKMMRVADWVDDVNRSLKAASRETPASVEYNQ